MLMENLPVVPTVWMQSYGITFSVNLVILVYIYFSFFSNSPSGHELKNCEGLSAPPSDLVRIFLFILHFSFSFFGGSGQEVVDG